MDYNQLLQAMQASGLLKLDNERIPQTRERLVQDKADDFSPYGAYRSVSVRSYSISKNAYME